MKNILLVIMIMLVCLLGAEFVSQDRAYELATSFIGHQYPDHQISGQSSIISGISNLAYVYHLNPIGYIVISAMDVLPPVLAYSGTSDFPQKDDNNPLKDMIRADLNSRLLVKAEMEKNQQSWQNALLIRGATQYPPAGYSDTEGWVLTRWTQSHPYNMFCPMDPVSQTRSYAGCPAIAMAQILNYHGALNGKRFTDEDDYYHNYAGRTYWIDNDYATLQFPSFPVLNGHLEDVNNHFRHQVALTDSMKAALVFASGTTLRQVYSSGGSGTFGVGQAFTAYQRFGFPFPALIDEDTVCFYDRLSMNIMNAQPVHLAVVTPSWDAGHNVVVDGYNTNEFYHLNFGWGGSYDGWYQLPQDIPYNLTVIEGAVVDIVPYQYAITTPELLDFVQDSNQILEVINLHNGEIVVEELLLADGLVASQWSINPSIPLPATINENGMMTFSITFNGTDTRQMVYSTLRLILDETAINVPIRYESGTESHEDVNVQAQMKSWVYPNPFKEKCNIRCEKLSNKPAELRIYNLKGQLVFTDTAITNSDVAEWNWNGRDQQGGETSSGIYYFSVSSGDSIHKGKFLKIR